MLGSCYCPYSTHEEREACRGSMTYQSWDGIFPLAQIPSMTPRWMKFKLPNLDDQTLIICPVLICTVLSLHVWPRLPSLQVFNLLKFVTSFVFSCEQYSLFPTPPFSDYLLHSSGFSVSTTSSRKVHQVHHAHCIVHSFSKGLLRIPFVPSTVLGTRNVTVNKEEKKPLPL